MSNINKHDRKDIDRAAKEANKSVNHIGSNRTECDGVVRYGRGDIMKYLKK